MRRFLNIFLRYPVSLLLVSMILYLSLYKPAGKSALMMFANMDKVAHFLMYASLSAVMWYEHYRARHRVQILSLLVMSFVLPTLFSGAMEYMQDWLTDYRSADYMDFVFNVAGVLSANVVCFFVVRPLLGEKSKRKEIRQ